MPARPLSSKIVGAILAFVLSDSLTKNVPGLSLFVAVCIIFVKLWDTFVNLHISYVSFVKIPKHENIVDSLLVGRVRKIPKHFQN